MLCGWNCTHDGLQRCSKHGVVRFANGEIDTSPAVREWCDGKMLQHCKSLRVVSQNLCCVVGSFVLEQEPSTLGPALTGVPS